MPSAKYQIFLLPEEIYLFIYFKNESINNNTIIFLSEKITTLTFLFSTSFPHIERYNNQINVSQK